MKATNWQTGEVRYVRGQRSQMSPEKIVQACRSPRKGGGIQWGGSEAMPPDATAGEYEIEVSRAD